MEYILYVLVIYINQSLFYFSVMVATEHVPVLHLSISKFPQMEYCTTDVLSNYCFLVIWLNPFLYIYTKKLLKKTQKIYIFITYLLFIYLFVLLFVSLFLHSTSIFGFLFWS